MNAQSKPEKPTFEYDAFISYRRSDGSPAARWLRRALQRYRLPQSMKRGPGKKLNVYLDTIYERATEDFFENNIKPALEQSHYLIVITTPHTLIRRRDGSPNWVEREIVTFSGTPQCRNVLIARAKGHLTDSLPSDLQQLFPNIEIVSLRELSPLRYLVWPKAWRLSDELLKIVAALHEISREEMPLLRQEERYRRLKFAWLVSFTSLLLVAVMASLAALAFWQYRVAEARRREAERETRIATARRLAAQAELASREANQLQLSIQLAMESLRYSHNSEALLTLRQGLGILPRPLLSVEHRNGVDCVAFSPDSTLLSTTGTDGSIKVWQASDGRELRSLAPAGRFQHLAFGENGARIVAFRQDGSAMVWNWKEEQPPRAIERLPASPSSIEMSPDGRYLAISSQGWYVYLWDLARNEPPVKLSVRKRANAMAFSQNGTFLAIVGSEGTTHIWNTSNPTRSMWATPSGDLGDAVALNSTGQFVALAVRNQTPSMLNKVCVWEVGPATNQGKGNPELLRIDIEPTRCCLALSPDGNYLGLGAKDIMRVLSVRGRNEVLAARLDGGVLSLAFSPDGNRVAARCEDRTVRVWDIKSCAEIARVVHEGPVNAMAFDQKTAWLATASSDGFARSWELSNALQTKRYVAANKVRQFKTNAGGEYLVVADQYSARVLDSVTGEAVANIRVGDVFLTHWDISPDGESLVTLSGGPTGGTFLLECWTTRTGVRKWSMTMKRNLWSVRLSPTGKYLAATSGNSVNAGAITDDSVILLDAETHNQIALLEHLPRLGNLVFDGQEKRLAVAAEDGIVRVFAIPKGDLLHQFSCEGAVLCLAFSHSGKFLATGSKDKTARIWDVNASKNSPNYLFKHPGAISDNPFFDDRRRDKGDVGILSFSQSDRYLATTCGDGWARVWDINTGQLKTQLPHAGVVTDAIFCPMGPYLATSCSDGKLRVWDVESDVEMARVAHPISFIPSGGPPGSQNSTSVRFTPDSDGLITSSVQSDTVIAWYWKPEKLCREAGARLTHVLTEAEQAQYLKSGPERSVP